MPNRNCSHNENAAIFWADKKGMWSQNKV